MLVTVIRRVHKLSLIHFHDILKFGCVPTIIHPKLGVQAAGQYKDLWFPVVPDYEMRTIREILYLHSYIPRKNAIHIMDTEKGQGQCGGNNCEAIYQIEDSGPIQIKESEDEQKESSTTSQLAD